MKKALFVLLLSAPGLFAVAQVRVALLGGGQQSSVIEENNLPGWSGTKSLFTPRTGIHAGFIADIALGSKSDFFFQPGVIFYNKGRKFSQDFDTSLSSLMNIKKTEFVNYVDIPFNLVYKFKFGKKAKFIIGGGPYANVFFTGKLKTETLNVSSSPAGTQLLLTTDENNDPPVGDGPGKYKIFGYGVNGLAGFEFGRVFITGNYSRGLDNFFKPVDYDASSYKHQVIGATIGVFIGNPKEKLNIPVDTDKDGITDEKDNCPNEPGDKITKGCPDADSDGIPDKEDKCPSIAGLLKYNGCPIPDTDGDGLNDEEDKCPTLKGIAKYAGCPVPDADNDGITDEKDKCPNEKGPVCNEGCPSTDCDGDGVVNEKDKCPSVKGDPKYDGCPIPDTDGDGINDEEDKCPSLSGVAANNGCPEIKKEVVEKMNYAAKRIQFQQAKATLLPQSLKILNEVAQVLTENPDLKLFIEGHTSNQGNYDMNMKLSDDRAAAVRSYLILKGIGEERLSSEGYGPNKPIADEKTLAGRALNRRVELKLNY